MWELRSLAANTKLYFLDVAENSLKSLRSLQNLDCVQYVFLVAAYS